MVHICLSFRTLVLMLLFPRYSAFNITNEAEEKSSVIECILKIIDNLPGHPLKITIFAGTEDSGILTPILKRTTVPVIVNSYEYHKGRGIQHRVFNNLVISIKDMNLDNVRRIFRNSDTKFLIVLFGEEDAEDLFKRFWKRKIINVFALRETSDGLSLYSYSPLQMNDCDNTKPILIDTWNGETFPNGGFQQINEDIRIRKAHGCPVNISIANVQPSVILPKDCNCNSSTEIDGTEARVLKVIVEDFHFSATYSAARDGHEWGDLQPPRGILGEVYTGKSDFAFGLISPFAERYDKLDLSRPYGGSECITFVLPAGLLKERFDWWTIVSADLDVIVLLLIFLTFCIVTLIFIFVGSSSPTDSFLYVLTTFLGQSIHTPEKLGLKLLLVFWILFSLCISSIYQVSLGREITVPTQPPEIKTFRQLFETNLKLLGSAKQIRALKMSEGDPIYHELVNRLSPANFTSRTAVDHLVKNRNIAYLHQMSIFSYIIMINRIADRKLRRLRRCIVSYTPVVALPKNSPYTKRVNQIITRLFESGIWDHWKSYFLYRIPERDSRLRAVQIGQSLGMFFVLVAGLALATLVFVCEVLFYQTKFFKKRKATKKRGK